MGDLTLTELAESICIPLGKEFDRLFLESVKSSILNARAALLKQEYLKTGNYNHQLIQTIKCIPLIKVNEIDCCTYDGCTNGIILRSKDEVPKTINYKDNSSSFIYVGRSDMRKSFHYINVNEIEYIKDRAFTKNSIFYTLFNNYIWIYNTTKITNFNISLVPENPLDVNKYNTCHCDNTCEEQDIIIQRDMASQIETIVKNGFKQIAENKETTIDETTK